MEQVLIAEDDKVARRVIARAIQNLGYGTIEASNGRITWELLQDNPSISLLITDMMMPEMDGRELIQNVRTLPHMVEMPIIIVSGIVTLREIDDILRVGASRFLPKPIDVPMLKQYASQLVTRYREKRNVSKDSAEMHAA